MRVTLAFLAPALCVAADYRTFVIGDWGGASKAPFTTPEQLSTASAMGKVGDAFKPSQVWGIGDNFYEDGITCSGDNSPDCVASAASHRFTDTFENVYTAPSLHVPWWFNAGNHDWHAVANTTAELARNGTGRWNFPAFYYTKTDTFTTAAGEVVTVQLVMIDTVILCGLTVPHANGQPIPPVEGAAGTPIPPAAAQWDWLASTLAASTADVLLVSGVSRSFQVDPFVNVRNPPLLQHSQHPYLSTTRSSP